MSACNVITSAAVLHSARWLQVAQYVNLLSCVHCHFHQKHANKWDEMRCCQCETICGCNMGGDWCKRQHRAVTQCCGSAAGKEVRGLWKSGWARRPLQVDKAQADLPKRHLTLKLLHLRLLSHLQNDIGTPSSDLSCQKHATQIVMHACMHTTAAPVIGQTRGSGVG